MSKMYVGDTGTLIELDTKADLVGATVAQIKVRKPSGMTVVWPATAVGTVISYTTVLNDLDTAGTWLLHAYVELPSGKWTGELATLMVTSLYK
jgi:hypothetical protein